VFEDINKVIVDSTFKLVNNGRELELLHISQTK
jgi:hypothetical protein